jgi:predicted house-cleaning noncanonical NTP pyrophosphatase (MazG superfamily)
VNKDIHEIIKDSSQMMPLYTYKDNNKYDKANVEEKMLYNGKEVQEDTRLGYKLADHLVDVPDDYLNR